MRRQLDHNSMLWINGDASRFDEPHVDCVKALYGLAHFEHIQAARVMGNGKGWAGRGGGGGADVT